MIQKDIEEGNQNLLNYYKLPVITSVNQLLKVFNISEKQESLFFFKNSRNKLYKKMFIPKKNGDFRTLELPCRKLKEIQKAINKSILSKFNMSNQAMAFVKNKSIYNNAIAHIGCKTLIKFDMKNFFGTIDYKMILRQFEFFGYGKNVSCYLAFICTNEKGVLPQGAPTSPSLSNLVAIKLDKRISQYCQNNGYKYTRYADDITLSSTNKLDFDTIMKIKKCINTIINEEGFVPNNDKFHYFYNNSSLNVTGININNNYPKVKKHIYRELGNTLRIMKKYSVDSYFKKVVQAQDENDNINEKIKIIQHLYGLAYFVKMVDLPLGNYYVSEFNQLGLRKILVNCNV